MLSHLEMGIYLDISYKIRRPNDYNNDISINYEILNHKY